MKRLVDIVNFNSDASCLRSDRWLAALRGGQSSELYRWAMLYVRHERPVVLGFTGSTLADVAAFNPETLELINGHPRIFGAVVRPFAHDIHLLRRPASFRYNVMRGVEALHATLPGVRVAQCYLPPEFMLSAEQVGILAELKLKAVFINQARFSADRRARIPSRPYWLHGLFGTRMGCLPIEGALTAEYLHAMQGYDSQAWNDKVLASTADPLLVWRDGESCFLVPNGIEREGHWLANESGDVERVLLDELSIEFADYSGVGESVLTHYPIHSFAEWMKEFRMLGFLARLADCEDRCIDGSTHEAALWLSLINSDVLSAVEKRAVKIKLRRGPKSPNWDDYTLHRTSREFEAEEYLALLGRLHAGEDVWPVVAASTEPHMRKLWARERLLRTAAQPHVEAVAADAAS